MRRRGGAGRWSFSAASRVSALSCSPRFNPFFFFSFFFICPACDMTLDLDSDYRCLSVPAISLSLAADPLLALLISCPSKCLAALTRPVSLLDQGLNSLSLLPSCRHFLIRAHLFFVIFSSLLTIRLQLKMLYVEKNIQSGDLAPSPC